MHGCANESFVALLRLPDSDKDKKYDEEIALRFLFLHAKNDDEVGRIRNFQDELEEFAISFAIGFTEEKGEELGRVFRKTFEILHEADGGLLRRWDVNKEAFTGGFLNTSFEALALPLGFLISNELGHREDVRNAAIEFWSRPEMTTKFATGKSTETRLRIMVPMGREILAT